MVSLELAQYQTNSKHPAISQSRTSAVPDDVEIIGSPSGLYRYKSLDQHGQDPHWCALTVGQRVRRWPTIGTASGGILCLGWAGYLPTCLSSPGHPSTSILSDLYFLKVNPLPDPYYGSLDVLLFLVSPGLASGNCEVWRSLSNLSA